VSVERQDSPRILRGTGDYLEVTLYSDGTPTDADALPTVTITRGDGTVIATAQPATKPADTTGIYRFTLTPSHTDVVADLVAVWSFAFGGVAQAVTTYGRVVGDLLFTEAEARNFDVQDNGLGALANTAHYTDRMILEARDRIQDQFEDIIEMPIGLRWFRVIASGESEHFLRTLKAPVVAVKGVATRESGSLTYTAFTSEELEDVFITGRNRLVRETAYWPLGLNNIQIDFEAGLQPIPEDLKFAALWKLRYDLVPTNLPRTALSQTTELGTFRLAAAGERGAATGIPIVDEILARYSRRALVVA
jgi:hypothetical protein